MKNKFFIDQCISIILWMSLFQASCLYARSEHEFIVKESERLLILAPHPDDETLRAADLTHRVLEQGGSVRSVVVTAGDAYVEAIQKEMGKRCLTRADFLKYGETRLEESRCAADILGNGKVFVDLFCFSDGSIYSMLVSHWRQAQPDKSEFTGFS